jgi:transposase
MTQKRKVFTAEFKAEAVKMMQIHGITKAAEDLGISQMSLRNWSKKMDPNKSTKSASLSDALKENKRLQKENQYLKKINEVLKKSTAIFSQGELPHSK